MNNTNAFRFRAMGGRRPWPNAGRLFVTLVGLLWSGLLVSPAQTPWYVATNGTGGGTNWADATNSLQGAIDASAAADTVWVSNGVYEAGGVTNFPTGTVLTNRVAIWKAITVQAFSTNPADTVIKGAWDPATNGPAAVRCVYMANGSSLIGFTLTNGATLAAGGYDIYGGGVWCPSTATVISNCVLSGNSAYYGGGAMESTLYNCMIVGNSSDYFGGGAMGSGTLKNCMIVSNSALNRGGGACGGTLYNCMIVGNSADYYGGGALGGTLYNCTLVGNSAGTSGGGDYGGTLINSIVYSNSAPSGSN